MLASTGQSLTDEGGEEIPLLVQLPPHMANFFNEQGYAASTFSENRSHARLRVRCEAILRSEYIPPFAKTRRKASRVLINDISRSGISIFVHEQMWPSERFSVEIHGRFVSALVVRCRKVAHCCFDVGAMVMEVNSEPEEEIEE